jgi:hypothetical protein
VTSRVFLAFCRDNQPVKIMKRIFGLFLLVLAIVGTVNFVRKFAQDKDVQAQTQTSGSAAYQQGQKIGKYSAPFLVVLLGMYGLRLLLGSNESTPAAPTIRRSPTSPLPPLDDPSLRGGSDTLASNPARLRISAWPWLAANSSTIYVALSMAVVGLAVVFIKFPIGAVLLVSSGIFLFNEIREAKLKFFGGDVCPGIVLSAQQNLVAVYTDLSAMGRQRPYPVIQILKQPLDRMTTGPAHDGMRVATAALYYGDAKAAAWKNFWPEVINCVVHDPAEIERVFGSISEEEWQMLDACLAQIPEAKLGLHHISPASLAAVVAEEAQAAYTSTESGFAPTRPWYKSPVAVIAGAALGIVAILTIGSIIIVAMNRPKPHTSPFPTHAPAAMQPPMMPQATPPVQPSQNPAMTAQPAAAAPAGQYAVGSAVEANWAGGWIPGKITRVNPGGFSVMVQLADTRFPHPIVLSINQIRMK